MENVKKGSQLSKGKQLKKMYDEDKLDIKEIAKLCDSSIEEICARLVKLNIIKKYEAARGYNKNYFRSDNNLTENYYEKWSKEDEIKLLELYDEKKLDIFEIARILKRPMGGISDRLVKLKIIKRKDYARGYDPLKIKEYEKIIEQYEIDKMFKKLNNTKIEEYKKNLDAFWNNKEISFVEFKKYEKCIDCDTLDTIKSTEKKKYEIEEETIKRYRMISEKIKKMSENNKNDREKINILYKSL
jgi:hypothetical protein